MIIIRFYPLRHRFLRLVFVIIVLADDHDRPRLFKFFLQTLGDRRFARRAAAGDADQ